MKLRALVTKAGVEVRLGKLTVLVGANNVGKSRTLRDIQDFVQKGAAAPTTLLQSLRFHKPPSFEDVLAPVEVLPSPNSLGNRVVRGIGPSLMGEERFEINLDHQRGQFEPSADLAYLLGGLAKFHLSYLDAASRLQVAQRSPSHNHYDSAPSTLLQALFVKKSAAEDRLRETFRATFGMDIRLDYGGMQQLMLRVATQFADIPTDPREQAEVMRHYAVLDQQGDGFRSFVGVVLSVLLSEGRIILLDEPEAFLHPMQARRLGKWLAEQVTLGDSQVVVATHNASFLAGILAANQPVDIYRLNRDADVTSYNLIAAEDVSALSRSPILSSQRVLEALFHRGVIVCEADADRAVYEAVAIREFDNRDLFFLHAHNKQTIKIVVELLRKATIPVRAIADIDILNSASDLEGLLLSFKPASDVAPILGKRTQVADVIDRRPDAEILSEIDVQVSELLEQLTSDAHTVSGARGALRRIESGATRWSAVKRLGLEGIPDSAREAAASLIGDVKQYGLFVVPVGELENWIEVGTKQKNKWVVPALQAIAGGQAGAPLKVFIEQVLAF